MFIHNVLLLMSYTTKLLTAKLYHTLSQLLIQHCAVHVVPESLPASDAASVSYYIAMACDCAKTGKEHACCIRDSRTQSLSLVLDGYVNTIFLMPELSVLA